VRGELTTCHRPREGGLDGGRDWDRDRTVRKDEPGHGSCEHRRETGESTKLFLLGQVAFPLATLGPDEPAYERYQRIAPRASPGRAGMRLGEAKRSLELSQ